MALPMVSRTILVPVDLYCEISRYADAHGVSWSAAVRRLCELQLDVQLVLEK